MLRPRLLFIAALIALAALAAACGGGGGSGPLPRGGTTASHAAATVKVFIPNAGGSSAARKPAYISPATATITIGVYTVNGATPSPTTPPVSVTIASSTDCTAGQSGTVCTITVTVPVATAVVLQISEYDASGNLLAQSLLGPINTTLATIPQQTVSVGGVPATIVLTPSGLSAGDDGQTHAITVNVSALDASGNTIIPPGAYPAPIALSISGDTNGALSLSTTSVASPGSSNGATSVTLTYNSAVAITTATIKAASGTLSASVPFAPIVFSPTSLPSLSVGGSAQTVTVSEAGFGGAFTVPGSGSVATVTCVPANCTPATVGGSITVSVAPVGAGTEAVSVIDANGGFANIPITVTAAGGGGELVAPSYSWYEYPTQSGGKNYGITVGPDGQTLWFLDRTNNALDSVGSPAGCTTACATINVNSPFPLFSAPPVALQSIVAGSDGNLYVADVGNGSSDFGEAYQVTCSNPTNCNSGVSLQLNALATPEPGDALSAPDGNIYFSSQYTNPYTGGSILYTSITGCCSSSLSNISVGYTPPSSINGMTLDASGQNLWFTDSGSGNIGYFPIPCTGSCTVTELPSGYTWCQDCGARHHRPLAHPNIGRPRHRSQCCGNPFTALSGIISAPDGYLYVAEPGANEIDRLSPSVWENCVNDSSSCAYTSITLPNASGLPQNLIVGPDGNVWFTDTTGYVGFVSLSTCASGTCKAFEYHVGGSPWGIAAGPDGDIWFTDSSTNRIGKVVL